MEFVSTAFRRQLQYVYSIADMAIWPRIYCFQTFYQQTIDEQRFLHLLEWYQRIGERSAVKAALEAYGQSLEGKKGP